MLEQRPLPEITWTNIIPPYDDYPFFKDCKKVPFRPEAVVFDLVNAWWLCEAATLAYSEPEHARAKFAAAGLPEVEFFSGPSTQCYLAAGDRFSIVAFRGTETGKRRDRDDYANIVADIRADFDVRLTESGQGGKVHRGFMEALDEVWAPLVRKLEEIAGRGLKIWLCGHSLGAALATLAADRFGAVGGLYTFGSPRVGDESFKRDFFVPTYRFVNNNDIVTQVPPLPYRHVGQLRYIDHQGLLHDDVERWQRWLDTVQGHLQTSFNAIGKLRKGFKAFVPDGLKDHAPTLYATCIWNNLVRTMES